MLEGIARGAIDTLLRSGVRIMEMFCGACNGMGFSPPTGGRSLRTGPRNFIGRCGNDTASVYLVGPEVAAASAITGKITDPRDLGLSESAYALPARLIVDDSFFLVPDESPSTLPIRRGSNIPPLPPLDAIPETLQGSVLLKVGDHVTTDHIVPAGAHFLPIRNNIPELAKHVFRVVDETFPERARKAGEGFIVAGENYGQGSSREQAALAPRYLGIRAVIAKSFARIHLANLVNFGLLPFVFADADDNRLINQGDALSVDTQELLEGKTYTIHNLATGADIPVRSPLLLQELAIVKAGGRLNWIRQKRDLG